MKFLAINCRHLSRKTPLRPGAKEDGCFRRLADLRYIAGSLLLGVLAGSSILSAILKSTGMEDSQEKDYSFWGNDSFLNLYDALVYERKFKSEYLERQIYERLLKIERSIVRLIENKGQ